MTADRDKARAWWSDLDPADWMFDGHPIKPDWMDSWRKLDWSKAWLDMGPSPAGNVGPYFHVPDDDDDCVHRLYPKLLRKPNHQAILEAIMSLASARALSAARAEERERCAKIAEQHIDRLPNYARNSETQLEDIDLVEQGYGNAALNIATAIRTDGQADKGEA